MAVITGWGGRVQVNNSNSNIGTGTALPILRWAVSDKSDAVETCTMAHNGLYDAISSVSEFDITAECLYDTNANPFGISSGLLRIGPSNPSTTVDSPVYVTFTLALDRANVATRSWYFPRVLLIQADMEDEVRGVVRYTLMGKATYDPGITYSQSFGPGIGMGDSPTEGRS